MKFNDSQLHSEKNYFYSVLTIVTSPLANQYSCHAVQDSRLKLSNFVFLSFEIT